MQHHKAALIVLLSRPAKADTVPAEARGTPEFCSPPFTRRPDQSEEPI